MASAGGGKIRSKRHKTSSKPYARRTSFFGRVTETVRDFITPSWLSNRWQGVPEDDETDGHRDVTRNALHGFPTRGDPEQDEQELYENPAAQGQSEDKDEPIIMEDDSPDIILDDQPSTSDVQQRGRKTPFNRYAKPLGASTPNDDIQIIAEKRATDKDDAASDTSISTSGCSSLVPHLDRADHREKLSKFNLDRLSDMGRNRPDSPRLRSDSPRNTSLWSETSFTGRSSSLGRPSRPQQAAQSSRRPTFNSSYFCTPRGSSSSFGNTTVTDSPGRSSPFSSPFYPGRTTFGGASAQSPAKRRRTSSKYEVHLPVKRHVTIRQSTRNDVDVTSQTAKRILETLEKMSTPIGDAKKIPMSPTASPFSFTPSRASRLRQPASTSHAPRVQQRGVRIPGPPTTGLHIPQVASIADSRQPPLSKNEPKREEKPETVSRVPEDVPSGSTSTAAPSSAGFFFNNPSTSNSAPSRTHDNTSASSPFGESSRGVGGKMKSSKRETHYKRPVQEQEDMGPPTNPVPLMFDKPFQTFIAPDVAMATNDSPEQFNFTTPPSIVKESAPKETTSSSAQSPFTFSAPTPKSNVHKKSQFKSSLETSGIKPSFSMKPLTSPARKDEDEVMEEEEEASGGIKVAKTLKTGSCLEVFGLVSNSSKDSTKNSSSAPTNEISLAEKFKPATGEWTCDACCVPNKPDKDNCACCSAPKPGATPANKSLFGQNKSVFGQNKPLFGQSSIAKSDSVPATIAKSTELPLQAAASPVVNCGFGDKFKAKAGEWECDACMIQNKAELTKCVACQMAKPGGAASVPMNSTAPSGFGDKFKPETGSWECDTCMLSNKGSVSRCVACETPKPGAKQSLAAPPASAYKFGTDNSSGTAAFSVPSSFKIGMGAFSTNSDNQTKNSPFKTADNGDKDAKTDNKDAAGSTNSLSKPGGFAFMSNTSSAPATTTAAGSAPFAFGTGAFGTDNSSSNTTSSSDSAGFKFGDSPKSDKASPFTTSKPESTPSAVKESTTAADNKDAGSTNSTSKPGGFSFLPNTSSTPATTSTTTAASITPFKFGTDEAGSTNSVSKPGGFAFGTNTTTTAAPNVDPFKVTTDAAGSNNSSSKPGGFSFLPNASSTPATTTTTTAASITPFKFGAATKTPATETSDQAKKPFVFGAPAAPASTSSQAAPSTGGFSFTSNAPASTNSQAPSTGGFSFSATGPVTTQASKPAFGGTETDKSKNSSPFVFGAAPASTNSQAPSTGGFSFTGGAPATTQQSKPAFGATNSTTNSVFQGFGSNSSSANPSPVFGNSAPTTTATTVPNFGTAASTPFGSQNPQQGAAAPAFGAANSGTPFGGTPAPAFGAGSTPAFGAGSAAPAFGGASTAAAPAFGNNNATQQNTGFQANATPAFQFGANNAQPNQQQNSVFKFGASENNATPNNTAAASGGFNFGAQQAPSFNFAASTPAVPAAGASPFQFNASGNQASNPFSPIPSSGSTHSGRKIKRAVRRNQRK